MVEELGVGGGGGEGFFGENVVFRFLSVIAIPSSEEGFLIPSKRVIRFGPKIRFA